MIRAKHDFARLLRVGLLVTTAMVPAVQARAARLVSSGSVPVTSSTYPGVECEIFQVPMRDGTLLSTRAYYPSSGKGPYPVIMQRDPYDRAFGGACFTGGLDANLISFAQNGYAAMDQSVRGTYTSQGVFNAMIQEAQDGYDAIEWAGTQSWSTGRVGTTSGSYLGLTQWQPAIHNPPHLAAIAPQITASDYHDNWTYVNGVLDLWFAMSWVPGFVTDQITRADTAEGETPAQIAQDVLTWNNLANANLVSGIDWVKTLPLTDFQPFEQFPPFYTWVEHQYYDNYWGRMDVENHWKDVRVPALINTASFDIFAVGSIRNFHGMRATGGTAEARAGTKLVMGAYGHPGDSGNPTFGDDGGDGSLLPAAVQLPFFDRYLKGIKNGWESRPVVQIYVLVPPNSGKTGTGFWISGQDFPLPGSHQTKYFLKSGGHANTSGGDGVLDTASGGAPDHFDYDPKNPVPTMGGAMCCNAVLIPEGAQDQTTVEKRKDVLVYTSKPLVSDQAVIGEVTADFWAISSAPDTDFTVKLVDVHPDGLSHNVDDRVVRASLRRGSKLPPELIAPGVAYEYKLEVGNTATMFRAGHKIRVEISSSNFPHYGRNLNTGKSDNETSETAVARQTILHNSEHPSYIELTIDPNVAIPPTATASTAK